MEVVTNTSGEIVGAETKATILRGYVSVLEERGLLKRVIESVPADTARLLREPPPATAWFARRHIMVVQHAIAQMVGDTQLRSIAGDALKKNLVPIIRPAIESLLRLFGISPQTLFRRLPTVLKSTTRNMEMEFTERTARSGTFHVRLPLEIDVPRAFFIAQFAMIDACFDILGERGNVGEPDIRNSVRGTVGSYVVTW